MKAIQLVAPGAALELREVACPEATSSDDVVIKVAGCGVCHTDIGFWRDGVATRHCLPLTLGHEISGTVVAGGEDLLGRDVIVPAVIPCGECDLCKSGRGNVCRSQIMPGNDIDGGFAEYVRVPARGLCVVEDCGDYELADLSVIADAVTTPYQAIVRSGLQADQLAIVVGVGGVGTYCVQIAAALGAHVIAIDVDASKLALIAQFSDVLTIDSSTTDFKTMRKQVAAAAADWGVAQHSWKIFECSGHPAGQETAFSLLTYASTLMVIGFTLDRTHLRLSNLMALDATAQGTWGCKPELYASALSLVTEGRITLRPFIEKFPLSDAPSVLERVARHEINKRAILVNA